MANHGSGIDAALEELYGAAPATFTSRRDALAKELKAAGDPAAAAELKARKKPTQIAYVLNQLARKHADDVADLVDVGRQLARAQRKALRGEPGHDLRDAIARQRTAVSGLTAKTATLMRDLGIEPSGHLDEVSGALQAALVDPAVGAQLEEGRLEKVPEVAAGFPGALLPVAEPANDDAERTPAPKAKATPEPRGAAKAAHESKAKPEAEGKSKSKSKAATEPTPRVSRAEAKRAAREEERRQKAEATQKAKQKAEEERREKARAEAEAAARSASAAAAERARAADDAEREADGYAAQAKKSGDEARALAAEAKKLAAEAKRVAHDADVAQRKAERAEADAKRATAAAKRARTAAEHALKRAARSAHGRA